MKTNQYKHQGGFTLLELIVVVAVLGLITNLATEFVAQNVNQQRYDTTKDRLEKLKYAILGDDTRTVNGQPDLVGYIHDIGSAPNTLSDLVTKPSGVSTAAYNDTLKRTIGWRGPYISDEITDNDGWGNNWNYSVTSNIVTIESEGLDGSSGGTADYESDYSISIDDDDYLFSDNITVETTDDIGICVASADSLIESTSSDNEVDCQAKSGYVWLLKPAEKSCSYSTYTDQATCIANSGTWRYIPRQCSAGDDYTNETDCLTALGTWYTYSQARVQLSYVSDGSVDTVTITDSQHNTGDTYTFSEILPFGGVNIELLGYDYEAGTYNQKIYNASSINITIYSRRSVDTVTF